MTTNPAIKLPPDSEESRLRRATISHDWLSESEVLDRLEIDAETLRFMREGRQVIAAWDAPTHAWRYPPFQFQGGCLAPQVIPLLEYLVDMAFAAGWGEIEWLYSAHTLLEGRQPATVFIEGPERVLAVAYQEFVEERDLRW